MPVYDLSNVAILTPKLVEMQAGDLDAFTNHQTIAESLLGISSTSVSSNGVEVAKLAVALQMNYQIEVGLQPFIVTSSMRPDKGDSVVYRGGKQMPAVHPLARQLLGSVSHSDVPIVRSLR